MDAPFPFGFPLPTAFYLSLYLLTLVIHAVFMSYVLAGSAYLAAAHVVGGRAIEESPVVALLRDWLPFMLSAAITAGVAPLLFLQIIYPEHFYTANLLLFYRWMAILPVLIVGFYLAYLVKAKRVRHWPLAVRACVGCGVFGCFAFVGWSWVENHLLSVRPDVWAQQYASGELMFRSPELLPRLVLWFSATFPMMAILVGWQLWDRHNRQDIAAATPTADFPQSPLPGSRRICAIGMAGLSASSLAAIAYLAAIDSSARETIIGPVTWPYVVLALAGGLMQAIAWVAQFRQARLSRGWLLIGTCGLAIGSIGMAVANEATRLAALRIETLYAQHAEAWQIGGFPAFVAFFIINFALIAYCIRLVRRRLVCDIENPNAVQQ